MTSILVVDEDEVFARSLSRDLEADGFDAPTASTVQDAWNALERGSIDVVVTELRLGPHSGLELIRAVQRGHPLTSTVLMTSNATGREYQEAVAGGCAAFLTKPFSAEERSEAVEQALTKRTGFRGSVHGLTLTDMLQMFHFGRRSLEIRVQGKSSGYVRLCDGEVIDASSDDGNLRGMVALRHLLSREQGVINTGPLPEGSERTLEEPFDFLLMDAIRANDEGGTPHGVHSARPPRISWNMSVGNTALATHLSLVPAPESLSESVRRPLPSAAHLEHAVSVVSTWVDEVARTNAIPTTYRVLAVSCSDAKAKAIYGQPLEEGFAEAVVDLVSSAEAITEGRDGFLELVRDGLAIAVGWDLDQNTAIVLARDAQGAADCAKFRGHTSMLRRVVTKDL